MREVPVKHHFLEQEEITIFFKEKKALPSFLQTYILSYVEQYHLLLTETLSTIIFIFTSSTAGHSGLVFCSLKDLGLCNILALSQMLCSIDNIVKHSNHIPPWLSHTVPLFIKNHHGAFSVCKRIACRPSFLLELVNLD